MSAYKQEWHERGYFSLEVTVSGLVINSEYLWLGASPDRVVHIQVVLILMDYLKSRTFIITVIAPLFMQHPRTGFVLRWKRVSLF